MKFRTSIKPLLVLLLTMLFSKTVLAVQQLGQFGPGAGTPAEDKASASSADLVFYVLSATVIVELLAIVFLAIVILKLIKVYYGVEVKSVLLNKVQEEAAVKPAKKKWYSFERINKTVSIEKEGELLMDHDYDGIRELDNKMPPWFIWLFNVTIFFAVVYLLVYHVFRSAPLQIQEYKNELAVAEKQSEEFRKKSASLVDENSVVLLTDQAQIKSGQTIFNTNCVACHGSKGEGGVGPNLTDDYWLHGGSVKNIFKTIKYGVPEKGMKSWQQDISPSQMQELVSFIKTLHGTNPPNAKEKQGELYKDGSEAETKPADTTKTKADSLNTAKM
ncbi:cbb3-type cytochrome c oxidase N-terminal domain-containing protein [Solitalea lacus]|uniref:cbb3-type cytochrome c oxidase N-terminal domain-containing protein n=1 Tax=Solitalea lacus TaxID=2911172 RepID=UPI001EDBFBAC|nr:cbb3-type cytochrome c oxidase N-terminal domain-containing protein [Solitalea lacus]UKJ05923.1 c-type cytochrome [Solitalea lacus]